MVEHELPLTSNNIYSEIQASLLQPVYISSFMAHDAFLRDWMMKGEQDPAQVIRYLRLIREKYDTFSTFVVSALTGRYYYFDGILKEMSPDSAKDQWFFTMEQHPNEYRVDMDTNEAANDRLTIFINHRMTDDSGRFIGVTGLGLDVATTSGLITQYKTRYNRDIYFVDRQGLVQSHADKSLVGQVNIKGMSGISSVAQEVLGGDQGSLSYLRNGGTVFLRYRFIPELDWFLLVEQAETAALAPLRQSLYVNLAIGGVITVLVMLISGFTVHHFQSRLERMATVDELSGLFNRQYFEVMFVPAANAARRRGDGLALLMLDIDDFKNINDRYGHLAGDRVIERVAEVIREGRRGSDISARWGGDEFVLLLSSCDEANAGRIAEDLRQRISAEVSVANQQRPLTISIGVAIHRPGENLQDLLSRADERLYAAKTAGRNRVA